MLSVGVALLAVVGIDVAAVPIPVPVPVPVPTLIVVSALGTACKGATTALLIILNTPFFLTPTNAICSRKVL